MSKTQPTQPGRTAPTVVGERTRAAPRRHDVASQPARYGHATDDAFGEAPATRGSGYGSVEQLADRMTEHTRFHYTTREGAESILRNGVIQADGKNRTFLSALPFSPEEAESYLFIGADSHQGRGEYVIAVNVPEDLKLEAGTTDLEQVHRGSLRLKHCELLYVGPNPWPK